MKPQEKQLPENKISEHNKLTQDNKFIQPGPVQPAVDNSSCAGCQGREPVIYERYPLYLSLTAGVLAVLTIVWGGFMYLLQPGLISSIGISGMVISEALLTLLPIFLWSTWLIMFLAAAGLAAVHPVLLRISNRTLYAFFPVLTSAGRLIGIGKDRISQSLIDLINHLVELNLYKVEPARLLLLTPHCLQKNTCVHKVTSDVYNCKQCGQCQVGELLQIAKDYGCQFVVVTGGTLARMMIKKARPKAIIAIACERDLVSGMADVFPIPVIGVLNERPCGPCFNTRVDTDRIKKVVEKLIYGKDKK